MSWIEQKLNEKFDNPNSRIIAIVCAAIVLLAMAAGIFYTIKRDNQTNDFISREIHGVLIKLRNDQHGEYTLSIQQSGTKEILEYYLSISKFVRGNNIQALDSISKPANGHFIEFYKKKDGQYYKCCDLEY